MKYTIILLLLVLPGCSALPSMQYCEKVSYVRMGNMITLSAECHAPMGDIVSMPVMGALK